MSISGIANIDPKTQGGEVDKLYAKLHGALVMWQKEVSGTGGFGRIYVRHIPAR